MKRSISIVLSVLLVLTGFLSPAHHIAFAEGEPSGLTATAVSSAQINLSWTLATVDTEKIIIERKVGSEAFSKLVELNGGVNYSDVELLPNTVYTYRVKAESTSLGESGYSNQAIATTNNIEPSKPSNFMATTQSTTQINLTWSNGSNVDGYEIERKNPGGDYVKISTIGNTNSFNDSGLSPNTIFYYRIRAYNSGGYSPYSNEANATTSAIVLNPPAKPTTLSGAVTANDRITLTWADKSNNETGFKIERKKVGENYTEIGTVASNVSTYNDTGLSGNTTYYYRVRAYNSDGNSDYSNEISIIMTNLPSAPTNLEVTIQTSTKIELTWTDQSSNETGFKIERKTGTGAYSQIATVGVNVNSYVDSGLTSSNTYYYRVRAYNAAGNSTYSNEVNIKTANQVSAPTSLAALALTNSRVELTWIDRSNNESGFRIERKTGTGSYVEIGTAGANTESYIDTGLSSSATYSYRIRAYNSAGNSTYSNEVSIKMGDLLAPTKLSINVLSSSRIELNWTDNSGNETGFKIERKTGNGAFTEIDTVKANVVSYIVTGLSSSNSYTFRVRAYNSSANSTYSNEVSVKIDNVPNTPTTLTATASTNSRIELNWTDRSSNETGFRIERKEGNGTYSELKQWALI